MKLINTDPKTGSHLLLMNGESDFEHLMFSKNQPNKYFTIAWNNGAKQTVTLDGVEHSFMPQTILPLMFNQTFDFENPSDIVAWQFNREFYCVIDHDAEVSCVGFLFAGSEQLFIPLDEPAQDKFQLLLKIFTDEMKTQDNIQKEMLVVLLKRLIIFVTTLAKSTYIPNPALRDERVDIFRKFNLLVEGNFRTEKRVSYYADRLNKSPKTLSNLFALYNLKTPQQVIQDRILIEAKRLLCFTSKSVKEICYELGFEDPAHFTTFFKNQIGESPVSFRNQKLVNKRPLKA
jgi:AraC family transcriptional activator of pobA